MRIPGGRPLAGLLTNRRDEKILDAIDLAPRAAGEILEAVNCRLAGVADEEIAAVVRFADGPEFSTSTRLAWRLNRHTERIEPISPEGIDCRDDTPGE